MTVPTGLEVRLPVVVDWRGALVGRGGAVRYAAIGDSFTEGVGDELPDGAVRGWADRVAAGLAATRGGDVQYANLAVRGRLLAPIVTDQLEAALSLVPAPTLITLNGGGNDMLRPGVDVASLVALTERAVRRCADTGVRLVLISGADPSDRLPFGRTVHRRAAALTAGVAALAAAHALEFVDVFHDTEIRRAEYWSADRLHLNAAGHQRVAELVLATLGEGPAARAASAGSPAARRLLAEARYYREHVLPWSAAGCVAARPATTGRRSTPRGSRSRPARGCRADDPGAGRVAAGDRHLTCGNPPVR